MTTRQSVIVQTKEIAEQYKSVLSALEIPLYLKETSDSSLEATFHFHNIPNFSTWDSLCSVNVLFDYCVREESDDVGYFTKQDVKIHFRSNSSSSSNLQLMQAKLHAYNNAVGFMALLVSGLPESIVERTATHVERAEENKITAAERHCRTVVSSNCKNMRVEGAKCLPVAPETVRRGEYTITRADKKFTVTLTDQHTLLVRAY